MFTSLLILFCGMPVAVVFLIAVERFCSGHRDEIRRELLWRRFKSLFGRELISSSNRAEQCGYLVTLFAWIAAIGGVVCGLLLPQADGIMFGVLFVIVCCLIGISRDVPQCLRARSALETESAVRRLLQSASLWLAAGISLVGVSILCGSLSWQAIIDVQAQSGVWGVLIQPLGFLSVLTVASTFGPQQETPEESDLARCCQLIAFALIIVCAYCGGWHLGGVTAYTTAAEPGLIHVLLRGFVIVLKTAMVLTGLVLIRRSIDIAGHRKFLPVIWNLLLPVASLNAMIAFVSETCLQPGDALSRTLLSWIVVCGGAAYGLFFHRGSLTAHWDSLRS